MGMLQGVAWLFFVLMALILMLSYLAIRREWFPPAVTAGTAVITSVIFMVLTSLSQGNSLIQAVIVGILIGGLFSGATIGLAWYFHSSTQRQGYAHNDAPQADEPA